MNGFRSGAALLVAALVGGCGGSSGDGAPAGSPALPGDDGGGMSIANGLVEPEGAVQNMPSDDAGRVSVVNGFVEVESTTLNANGAVLLRATKRVETAENRLVEEGENFESGTVFSSILSYDRFGDLIRTEVTSTPADEETSTRLFTFEHDARGLLRSSTITDASGAVETQRFRYDARDRLVERETREGTEEDGTVIEGVVYTFGADGLPVSSLYTFIEPPGTPDYIERATYTHDADGRLVGYRFDESDDGSVDGESSYEYDASGNMVRRVQMDGTGAVTRVREYAYEAVDEPIFNRWLRGFRYFL